MGRMGSIDLATLGVTGAPMEDQSSRLSDGKRPSLFVLMAIATIAVVVVSLVGIATIIGIIPRFGEEQSTIRLEQRQSADQNHLRTTGPFHSPAPMSNGGDNKK